jgi:hypothetical protein
MSTAHSHRRHHHRNAAGTLSRRLLLGLAGAGAIGVGGTLPSAVAKGRGGTRTESMPRTLIEVASGADATSVAFPVGYVGVRWTGPQQGAGIRFRSADGTFEQWRGVSACCRGARDDLFDAGHAHTALVAAGTGTTTAAVGYELRLPAGTDDVYSVAINTRLGVPVHFSVPTALPRALGLTYRPRVCWGADEQLRYDAAGAEVWSPAYSPAQALTVHHTVTANDDPDPAATIRAIYRYHAVDQRFGDIGYHFLIDEAGRLYEGRHSGPDGLPGHREDGQVVTAGHVLGYNTGNIGIALLGDFTGRAPSAAAWRTLTLVLAGLARIHGLDPLGTVHYFNPVNAAAKDVNAISGHLDWLATECPGETLYPKLGSLRADVARLVGLVG